MLTNKALDPYVPPIGDDEPLDAIELALVRALVKDIVAELRREEQEREANENAASGISGYGVETDDDAEGCSVNDESTPPR